MNWRIALRSLRRNRWRTFLTLAGIAAATAIMIWSECMVDSMLGRMVDSATAVELGHVQVHSEAYIEEPNLYGAFDEDGALAAGLRALPNVAGVAPRVYAFGLVGHEKRSQVARLVGVEVGAEDKVTVAHDELVAGEWLSADPPPPPAPREVVLGSGLAKQLRVEPGAELVVIAQGADGSLGNDLLKVSGVVTTGNTAVDRMNVYMHLADAQYLTALEGRVHELAIGLTHRKKLAAAMASVGAYLAQREPPGDDPELRARTWEQLVPEMRQIVDLSKGQMNIVYLLIFAIAALGILNTQRMSALERRREFGVQIAIGVTPMRLARLVVQESVLLTFVGGLLGLALGAAASYYHAYFGLDYGSATANQEGMTMMGVSFAEPFYFDPTARALFVPVIAVAAVGFLCGLWPAVKSARLDVVRAIAGRT